MKKEVEKEGKNLIAKNSSGITLIALTITVIVMMIIATISIYEGTKVIKEAKVQTLEANMLAIKAKAKTYIEEVEAATWAIPEEEKATARSNFFAGEINENGYKMILVDSIDSQEQDQLSEELQKDGVSLEMYEITLETLKKMGLNEAGADIKDGEQYIVVYDLNNVNSMDIIYTAGIEYKGEVYYTLSALQLVHDEE